MAGIPDDPGSWLTSAAIGAAAVALPPMLMSTLMVPEASPATLPRSPAAPLAQTQSPPPLPTPTPPPDPAAPVYTGPPDEGVEPPGTDPPDPTQAPQTTPQAAEKETLGSCPASLAGTRPHVAMAGWFLIDRFDLDPSGIIGRAPRDRASEHPLGLALDFPVDRATGDRLVDYVLDHRTELGVEYVIWRQRINFGSGFRQMEDRGSPTANHFDHVHVSFRSLNGLAAELVC